MMQDLAFDVVELVPCPAPAQDGPGVALREVAFRENAWLPEDTDDLRRRFAADEHLQATADALGRTLAAVSTKVRDLGLRRNSSLPWPGMDDATLAEHYGHEATSTIAATLGRSCGAVYARAGLLGLAERNPPPYTAWEIMQIRAGYAQGVPVAQLGVLIGRPASGIATIASRLGIRHANGPRSWSGAEQHRALELADTGLRYAAVAGRLHEEGFPRRSGNTVGQALRLLGYGRGWGRPWLPEEDDLLRDAYAHNKSLTPLRTRLGRSRTSIAWRAGELELQGTHARPNGWRTEPSWTEEDIAVLRRDAARTGGGSAMEAQAQAPSQRRTTRILSGSGLLPRPAHPAGSVTYCGRPHITAASALPMPSIARIAISHPPCAGPDARARAQDHPARRKRSGLRRREQRLHRTERLVRAFIAHRGRLALPDAFQRDRAGDGRVVRTPAAPHVAAEQQAARHCRDAGSAAPVDALVVAPLADDDRRADGLDHLRHDRVRHPANQHFFLHVEAGVCAPGPLHRQERQLVRLARLDRFRLDHASGIMHRLDHAVRLPVGDLRQGHDRPVHRLYERAQRAVRVDALAPGCLLHFDRGGPKLLAGRHPGRRHHLDCVVHTLCPIDCAGGKKLPSHPWSGPLRAGR